MCCWSSFSVADERKCLTILYGSANFMNLIISTTVGPGNPFYSAAEASFLHQHSPKMDTYSSDVLLVEMSLRELFESRPVIEETRSSVCSGQPWCLSLATHGVSMSDIMELSWVTSSPRRPDPAYAVASHDVSMSDIMELYWMECRSAFLYFSN